MRTQNGGGRSLNVRIDTALLQALLTAHAAFLSMQYVGWHDFLRLAYGRGADVLMREVAEGQARTVLSYNTEEEKI